MVGSWYCVDRVVPEGMSQVSSLSEVGNYTRRTPNTRPCSGTSVGTFACPAGQYINYCAKAGTKNEPDTLFVSKKGLENWSLRFQPKISLIAFSRNSGPPLRHGGVGYVSNRRRFSLESRLQGIS